MSSTGTTAPGDAIPAHAHAPLWAMGLAFGAGVIVAVQARITGQLALVIDDGLLAASISFGTSLLLVALMVLAVRGPRHALLRALPAQLRSGGLRWWHLLGGLMGATLVAGQGLVVPLLGVALFTVLAVAGTTSSSMASDRFGIGPGGRRPVTTRRLVAAVIAVLAVALAVSGRLSAGDLVVWAVVLAFVAGVGTGVQPALNGQVAARTGEPLVATFVNMAVGFVGLLVVLAIEHARGHAWTAPPPPWDEPVLWLAGAIGVAFILTAAIVVGPLGVLLLSLLSTAGQLAGSLVVDVVSPTPGTVVDWQLVVGTVVALGAVVLAAYRPRRSASSG